MNLRKAARGRACQVRLPGCDGGGETTVLCHYRLPGLCGVGMKPPDLACGAWACATCHDKIDGRRKALDYTGDQFSRSELRLAHAEGVMRTISELSKEGVI